MIGIIGIGKLGTVIAKRLEASKEFKGKVIAAGRNRENALALGNDGITIAANALEAVQKSNAIIICVKPKDMETVLATIGGECKGKLVVSVAAGIPIAHLEKKLPGARVARCMPNLAVAIGMSETAITMSKTSTGKDRKAIEAIFGLFGSCHYMEEAKLTAWIGLSGSYPAYVALLIEAAAQAAQAEGFGRAEALQLACKVTMASSKLLLETGEAPMDLVKRVASPGGTTEAGLKVAAENGLQESLKSAIAASVKRARELEK